MRIAILGAGFAGLATAWHLIRYTRAGAAIDLFDPEPIGGGVSGLSSGLLHTYTGKAARKAWYGDKALEETHRLITAATEARQQPVILTKGILRPSLTPEQTALFQQCAATHADTQWWSREECLEKVSGLVLPLHTGGLFVPHGLTLDVKGYLEGLWQSCARLGVQRYNEAILAPERLAPYDKILIALGARSKIFRALEALPITPVKGQTLLVRWPLSLSPLPFSINSHKYLVMGRDGTSCLLGATFEHQFTTSTSDLPHAIQDIFPKVTALFPALQDAPILECRAGIRATTPSHLPLAGKLSDKVFFFAGLGSKGLLYHAWLGKRVARMMLSSDAAHIPSAILWSPPKKREEGGTGT